VSEFIMAHRDRFGVEPICRSLQVAPSSYYAHKARPPSARAVRDAQLIGPRGPWRTATQVELATLAWVQWWNQRRLHGALDHIPPAEHEAIYYRQHSQSKEVA
jgi:transposase InsO family protein